MANYLNRPLGFEQVTSLSSAAGLASIPGNANFALIECDHTAGRYVRWRDDGTNPTTTVGNSLAPGQTLEYDGDFSVLKFIEESASAKINVSYYLKGTR